MRDVGVLALLRYNYYECYYYCVSILNTAIENARKNRIPLYVCYVDFQKAFDNVKHDLLWGKLAELGLSRKMLVILQSMYSTATSRLKVSATKCNKQSRVRQNRNIFFEACSRSSNHCN